MFSYSSHTGEHTVLRRLFLDLGVVEHLVGQSRFGDLPLTVTVSQKTGFDSAIPGRSSRRSYSSKGSGK